MCEPQEEQALIDVHDIDSLKKLWFIIRDAENSQEVFAIIKLLIDSLPYDWIDKNTNWLALAQQLEQFGEAELASLFKLANRKCFQFQLKGL